jgi:molybdopterin synthase sulfur carrier subunit
MATVRLFASARIAAGVETIQLEGDTVGAILAAARAQFGPEFTQVLSGCQIWLNQRPATEADWVTPEDEVAVLPPVSGG